MSTTCGLVDPAVNLLLFDDNEIVGVRKKAKKQNLFVFSKKAKSYLNEFEMGLMAYTPNYKAKDFDPDNNTDRPFAGWIYGQYGQHYVFKRSIFFSGLQIGSLGPNDTHVVSVFRVSAYVHSFCMQQ